MKRLLAILALVGCAATPPPCETCPAQPAQASVVVCVDDAFTSREQAAISNAARRWTDALCGLVQVSTRVVDGSAAPADCRKVIYRVESSYPWIQATTTPDTLGFCDGIGGRNAWLIADVAGDRIGDVATHEIGHSLGTTHGGGAMAARLSNDTCLDRRAAVMAALAVAQSTWITVEVDDGH